MRPSEAEEKYVAILRSMSGNQRVKIGAELYELAKRIVEASIRNENPAISEEELRRKIIQRMQT